MLKRNLIANYLGQGWVALMGFAFIPLYIKYLGIEAYGLIGLFAVLTALLSLLDMGMTPTLAREMARFTGGDQNVESIRDLLRSFEVIVLGIALIVSGGATFISDWLASSWLRAETLSVPVLADSFALMGLVIALRLVEGVYRSCLVGLQRQGRLNLLNSSMATLRGLGAVGVLAWISPTIQAYFLWQGLVSACTLGALVIATYSVLPESERPGRFSLNAMRSVWRFAGGMMGITVLALLLTQADKILLSKLLPLAEYSYYTIAAVVSGALYMLITPITQAWSPRLSQLHAANDEAGLILAYHQGAQLVTVIVGSAALVLIVFAEPFLLLWTQDAAIAQRVAPLLSILALGTLLNALVQIPYQTQLAYGWTGLATRINLAAVLMLIPAVFWAAPRYGGEGAAWVWVTLNAGYFFVGVHFMYTKILVTEKVNWYVQDVLLPLSSATATVLFSRWTSPPLTDFTSLALAITLTSLLAIVAATFAARHPRQFILSFVLHRSE